MITKGEAQALSGKICDYIRQEYGKQQIFVPATIENGINLIIAQHVDTQWDTGIQRLKEDVSKIPPSIRPLRSLR